MMSKRTLAILLCGIALSRGASAEAETASGDGARRVHHVVIVWLKEAGSPAAREQYIAQSRRLSKLPMVMDYKVGTALPKSREIVDSSYDVAVVSSFANQQAIADYLNHPEHQRIVDEALKPLVAKAIVYDFTDAP